MNHTVTVGFATSLSGRWPRELPEHRLAEYGTWLKENLADAAVVDFGSLVDSPARAREAAARFGEQTVDLVVLVYGAFTGDDISTILAEQLGVPLILWAPYEPPFTGGRLLANGLVAAIMNSAAMHRLNQPHHVVYGSLDDPRAAAEVRDLVAAYRVVKQLRGTVFGLFGYRPTAFYNSTLDEGLIRRTFGIRFEETSLKTVFDRMASLADTDVSADMGWIDGKYSGDKVPAGYLRSHSALYLALGQLMAEQGYDFGALKCWPEMGNACTTPCAALGRLADQGRLISCESDIDAGLAMVVQNLITGLPPFVTDMINVDETANTLTFWHCGNAAQSLFADETKAEIANHPLAGQGVAFRATLKPGPVTVARFCNIGGVYKLFLIGGTAVATQMVTPGTMVDVHIDPPVRHVLTRIIDEGVAHHFSLVWAEVVPQLALVARLLGIPVIEI